MSLRCGPSSNELIPHLTPRLVAGVNWLAPALALPEMLLQSQRSGREPLGAEHTVALRQSEILVDDSAD